MCIRSLPYRCRAIVCSSSTAVWWSIAHPLVLIQTLLHLKHVKMEVKHDDAFRTGKCSSFLDYFLRQMLWLWVMTIHLVTAIAKVLIVMWEMAVRERSSSRNYSTQHSVGFTCSIHKTRSTQFRTSCLCSVQIYVLSGSAPPA